MQTVYSNTTESILKATDEKIMCLGKNLLFKTRFGIGQEKVDLELYTELSILREALCIPTCIEESAIKEIINKKLN